MFIRLIPLLISDGIINGEVGWINTTISKKTFFAKCKRALSLEALSVAYFWGLNKVLAPNLLAILKIFSLSELTQVSLTLDLRDALIE